MTAAAPADAAPVSTGTAYASAAYVRSLSFFGRPQLLPHCGGWLLQRPIAGTDRFDLCGSYPLFSCQDWGQLEHDLAQLGSDPVSVAMVVDPFAALEPAAMARCFPDRCFAFKQHFVRDLDSTAPIAPHHRRNLRLAASVDVEWCDPALEQLDSWCRLYEELVHRHGITGVTRFSRESFAAQLSLPGMQLSRAMHRGRPVGMALWLAGAQVVYYHLAAYATEGYRCRAAYALFDAAIRRFRNNGFRWLELGGAAGTAPGATDGLARFKAGWATGQRMAWFGGRVVDAEAYRQLTPSQGETFFPAYRATERREI